MNQLDLPTDIIKQDIKAQPLSEADVDLMKEMAGSFEDLFSKRARLYKERNLKDKDLQESDFKQLLLEHYTFLKRPVLINNDEIFVGNSKKTIEMALKALNNTK